MYATIPYKSPLIENTEETKNNIDIDFEMWEELKSVFPTKMAQIKDKETTEDV